MRVTLERQQPVVLVEKLFVNRNVEGTPEKLAILERQPAVTFISESDHRMLQAQIDIRQTPQLGQRRGNGQRLKPDGAGAPSVFEDARVPASAKARCQDRRARGGIHRMYERRDVFAAAELHSHSHGVTD